MPLDLLVVIPAFNEERFIEGCLSSINQGLNGLDITYKVVVVDNGSSDRTGELASGSGAMVIRIERSSVSRARNVGAMQAQSSFIAFIDADVVVAPEWGGAFLHLFKSREVDRVLTGCQYSVRDNAGWIEEYWFKNIRDKHLNGGNIIVSRPAFEVIGGFDENLKTGEDYDFCIRAASKGVAYEFDDSFRAIHLGYPRTLLGFIRREIWHGEGDFKSLSTVLGSPVAIIALFYALILILVPGLIFSGEFNAAAALFFGFLLFNFTLTKIRFPMCGMRVIFFNSSVNFFYFVARALSSLRAISNFRQRY